MLLRVHHRKDQSDAVLEIETASNHLNQRNLGQEPLGRPPHPPFANASDISNTSCRKSTSLSVFEPASCLTKVKQLLWIQDVYTASVTATGTDTPFHNIAVPCSDNAHRRSQSLIAFQMDITEDIDLQTESVDLILCHHIRIIIRYEDVPQP